MTADRWTVPPFVLAKCSAAVRMAVELEAVQMRLLAVLSASDDMTANATANMAALAAEVERRLCLLRDEIHATNSVLDDVVTGRWKP